MSADIVASAIATMAQHPDECWFAGPRDHDVVLAAEAALGLKFPEAYRLFATQLGAGSFGAQEILGVISDDFANSGIPDCVWKTLKDREELNRLFSIWRGGVRGWVEGSGQGSGSLLPLKQRPRTLDGHERYALVRAAG
jgi:hypothetical protein